MDITGYGQPSILTQQTDGEGTRAFRHSLEHLGQELRRAELIVRAALLRYPPQLAAELEQYKGLFISDEEVELLLAGRRSPEDHARLQQLDGELAALEQQIAQRLSESDIRQLPLALLRERLRLEREEYISVIMLLAIELERRYEKLYAYLQDDITCKYVTPDLLLKLVATDAESEMRLLRALHPAGTLSRLLLKRGTIGEQQHFLSRPFVLEPQVLRFVLGETERYRPLQSWMTIQRPDDAPEQPLVQHDVQEQLHRIVTTLSSDRDEAHYYGLYGRTGSGRKHQLYYVYGTFGRELVIADLNRMDTAGLDESVRAAVREALLRGADLVLEGWDDWALQRERELQLVRGTLREYTGIIWLLGEEGTERAEASRRTLKDEVTIPLPSREEAQRLWQHYAQRLLPPSVELDVGNLAATFQMTPGQIRLALQSLAAVCAELADQLEAQQLRELLHTACYRQIHTRLDNKATRLAGGWTWEQLILPESQKRQLRYACDQVKHRSKVYDEWGLGKRLPYGKGLSLLFTGPPGTGKTMSARIIAGELQMQLYQINLSQVVSKYIGETEKHLQEVFDEARYSSSILFFDEADALFGKRSEVSDSHDRFANMETSFLLQQMESYEGITVLATNYRQNLDDAFMRRISFIVRFPFPDEVSRKQIWLSMLPATLPLEPGLDWDFLARTFEISGGQIKNIIVAAAFIAAAQGQALSMDMLLTAVRLELEKGGLLLSPDTLGMYADLW
ncbi:ATP-binding protein [Paenibacillus campi]|uniref:ATP-binding protein n=1 Tax=Paenibacillus campi TaxID=3106031 RepID=UPI002AFFE546|nr:ATP-binding protein [Paenibacillus sp. SGZ-1009]